ncbi:MAG: hypothetical protein ACFB2Z_04500 [Maricaulaceae bacterium]
MAIGGFTPPPVIGIGANLIIDSFNANLAAQVARLQPSAAALPNGGQAVSPAVEGVIAPFDPGGPTENADDQVRGLLAGDSALDFDDSLFAAAPQDQQTLFQVFRAFDRLGALAAAAADEDQSPDVLIPRFETVFQEQLSAVRSFVDNLDLNAFDIISGEVDDTVQSEGTITRASNTFETRTLQNATRSTPLSGVQGDEQLTITVGRPSGPVDVNIDFANLSGPPTIGNIAALFNQELEAAGVLTRFAVTRTDGEEAILTAPTEAAPFGLQINGSTIETLSFSAPDQEQAVFLATTVGENSGEFGRFTEINGFAAGAPQTTFSTDVKLDRQITDAADADQAVQDLFHEDGNFIAPPSAGDEEELVDDTDRGLAFGQVAANAQGDVFVVGRAAGDLNGRLVPAADGEGAGDAVLTRFDSAGNVVFTRTLGDRVNAEGLAVAATPDGGVVIAGFAEGEVGENLLGGGQDGFVTRFNAAGEEVFTARLGGGQNDQITDLAVAADGTIFAAGTTTGPVTPGASAQGGEDAFVVAINGQTGAVTQTNQFGATGDDPAPVIAVGEGGELLLATQDNGDAVVRALDPADLIAAPVFETNLGPLANGSIVDIAAQDGTIAVLGETTDPGFQGGVGFNGSRDAFVAELETDGSFRRNTFVGTAGSDTPVQVAIAGPAIFVAGSERGPDPDGGVTNFSSFVSRLENGAETARFAQSGQAAPIQAGGLAVSDTGSSFILDRLGLPSGALIQDTANEVTNASSVRPGDSFFVSVNGGAQQAITVEEGDTLTQLALRINAELGSAGASRAARTSEGDRLEIAASEGNTVELFAGPGQQDALAALGLTPGAVVGDTPEGESERPILGLEIPTDLSLTTRAGAQNAADALNQIQTDLINFFRDVTEPPTPDNPLLGAGPPPQAIQNQIANFQAALTNLSQPAPGAFGFGGLF